MSNNHQLSEGAIVRSPNHQYHILSTLGQGGFGITYLAETTTKVVSALQGELGQVRQTHEATVRVALKEFFMRDVNGREGTTVTSSQLEGCFQKYLEKFKTEARNLSRLKHPNIVSVLEMFPENNTMYYAMEFVEGMSLQRKLMQDGPMSEDQVKAMAVQIGDALMFMHSEKMLHLDLKPGNIMVRNDGTPVLIDFGLSKQYDEDGAPESSTTIGAGTKGFAPLEQVDYHGGMGFPVTLDIYAFGATLYKMLTGITPPVASEVMNDGLPLLPLRQLGVSSQTIQVIQKAMMPVKAMRYQSVKEMMDDLTGVSQRDERTVFGQSSSVPSSTVNESTVYGPAVNESTAYGPAVNESTAYGPAVNNNYTYGEPQPHKSNTTKIILAILIPLLVIGTGFVWYLLLANKDDGRSSTSHDSEYAQTDEDDNTNSLAKNKKSSNGYVDSPAEGGFFVGTIGGDTSATLEMPMNGSTTKYTFAGLNRKVTFDSYNPDNHSLVLKAYDASGNFIGRFVGTLGNVGSCHVYKGVFTNTSGGKVNFNLQQVCD